MALPEATKGLVAAMQQAVGRWRVVTKQGGVMRLSELEVTRALGRQLNIADLDEMGEALQCNWAYNHKQRIVYFIPLEMTEEQ